MAIDNLKLLKSNMYQKGSKWSLMPKNKIDTVKGTGILNEITSSLQSVASAHITKASIASEGSFNLPLSDQYHSDSDMDVISKVINSGRYNVDYLIPPTMKILEFAKGIAGVIYGTIEVTLKSSSPVLTGAVLEVTLNGNTRSKTNIPYDELNVNDVSSVFEAVENETESSFAGDSVGQNYSKGKIAVCPFLKEDIENNVQADVSQINTQWDMRTYTDTQLFSRYTHMAPSEREWNLYNTENTSVVKGSVTDSNSLWYNKIVNNIVQNFTQLDMYTFSVTLKVPLIFIGGAKARMRDNNYTSDPESGAAYQWWSTGDLIGSFAFIDQLTSVDIDIKGRTVKDDELEFAYSLNEQQELTSDLKNQNVFNFIQNELITPATTCMVRLDNGSYALKYWTEFVTKNLLKAYKEGKYIFECDINFKKFFDLFGDQSAINTPFKVYDINNNLIKRNNRDVVFRLKTIEKRVEKNTYIMHLKALEEKTVPSDDFKASLIYEKSTLGNISGLYRWLVDKKSTDLLECVDDPNAYYGEDITRYGYSIALTSSNTIIGKKVDGSRVGSKIYLPGNKIGTKIAIVSVGENAYSTMGAGHWLQLGFINARGEKIVDNDVERIRSLGMSHIYSIAIVDITGNEQDLTIYGERENYDTDMPIMALRIYNLKDYNVTKKEVVEYIVEHGIEPRLY